MGQRPPIILWLRRDLRLADHPAMVAAIATGQPVIPLFIHDEVVEVLGAAAKFRLGLSLENISTQLRDLGAALILRRGRAHDVLRSVVAETGATGVFWSRLYDTASKVRDTEVKAALRKEGVKADSHPGHVLFEPWTVSTKTGGFYKVYTPFWNTVKQKEVGVCLPAPKRWPAPANWPKSATLSNWKMDAEMNRGAAAVAKHQRVGERAAQDRLRNFIEIAVDGYKKYRDFPGLRSTSGLSENLTYGEISPRMVWHAGARALNEGHLGAEHFLKELVWREFSYHLIHHTPWIETECWRRVWESFPWRGDTELAEAWRRGRTGIPFVDAAMREMYVTGTMHNRARMIVGSYLTKHLLTDWRIGQAWFADCLTDWDPAANAMGWQWVAGCGPDATPYFRVFNPVTQADKFDADQSYQRRWIAEGYTKPSRTALSYFKAVPRSWALSEDIAYPDPIVSASDGRGVALVAYSAWKEGHLK
ncbi:cryptochrome/photolyase family protein [Pseudohalocynthiibacter aestuariivivens]|jgi:deoxyribodipyrimidine photo-lyase|uniref:Cryptochrome/photolyase family protein n=1 Tax=Pseudohalocynthiibacter aestuariivivens TaxID=1591409 RepID=A0ABV5JEW2_9RHOB|nr:MULTISPECIES: deoxyribodipyrimidine photo-lyase [Pseudohalocynthiibacter]MBS9718741.1 deoxyribodipyrimidine photo-lyase [Pseudohalocynthiibacter aestuariivivens]MCK0104360.1 DNA photolyase family protein [Pseudohalocynthiibacter sp. F2068]